MKVETTLRKITDKEFFPTLKRVMSKWPEAKDIHAFVKIAEVIENEGRAYSKTQDAWGKANGFKLPDGSKSANPNEITDRLLQEFGVFDPQGNLTIAGAPTEDKEAFLEQKLEADKILHAFSDAMNDLLEKPLSIEIPRLIKVDPKNVRKEQITAQDCYILLPILDLSLVSDVVSTKEDEEET